tara:strand:- start:27001 stop:27483 length:483 start_codon:yes stop_codon:yes gene_type:complete
MKNNINKFKLRTLIFALIIAFIDQLVKIILYKYKNNLNGSSILLFKINVVENYGAAFSILKGQTLLLVFSSVLATLIITIYIIKSKYITYNKYIYLSLLLGGTIGNAIDRITRGFVIDYIDLKFIDFAIFNISDIAINISLLYILLDIIFKNNTAKISNN